MKGIRILLSASLFIISCAHLPEISHLETPPPVLQTGCASPFPDGKWQVVHSIEAELPGGMKGFVIGAIIISSIPRTIACAIMSPEGFVLLDARQDQELIINRAIYPFDKKEFVEGLIRDVQLIFFRPDGPLLETGVLENGSPVCRYQGPDGTIEDIILSSDDTWEIRQYNKDLVLARTVKAWSLKNTDSPDQWSVPGRLKLTSHGFPGYELSMTLVDAVLLTR